MGMSALVLALSVLAQEEPTPWRPGVAWRWEEGERKLSAEVWDRVRFNRRPCIRLRFWHLESAPPWDFGDLYLEERDGDLLLAGYRVDRLDYRCDPPAMLLPKAPAAGQTWKATFENGSMELGEYRWHDVVHRVEGPERLQLPAGTFDTWKVLLESARDPKDAFRLWISAKAGIVRIESLTGKNDLKPWSLSLKTVDLKRPDRVPNFPELSKEGRARFEDLIEGLRHEDAAKRGAAVQEIQGLGLGVVPLLRARAAREPDLEVRGRLEAAAKTLVAVKVEAKFPDSIEAGAPLGGELRLRNDGPEPVLVLPCLPDSTMNLGRKYPAISARVTCPDGETLSPPLTGSFWGAPPLRGRDFRRVYPGETIDLFAEGRDGHPPALEAATGDPGTYTVRLVYDVSGRAEADWTTDSGAPDEEALQYLSRMVRGKFDVGPVQVKVLRKK